VPPASEDWHAGHEDRQSVAREPEHVQGREVDEQGKRVEQPS
jgi:hypothetical protein